MPPNNKPPMPNDTWPITKDDKIVIQDLGRKLNEFFKKEFSGKESVHIKIVVGAFNYIMDLQTQKTKLVADDFVYADRAVNAFGLTDRVEEPFGVEAELPEPTAEERRAHLLSELAALDAEIDVADASPAPSDSAPVDPEVEQPQEETKEDVAAEVAEATPTPA